MQELFQIVEDAGRCSYLPGEQARFDLRGIAAMSSSEYGYLLARGYRRFGWQVFRPVCVSCAECRSLRVPLGDYEPRASERRILRANAGIRARLAPLFVSPEHVQLYNRYQRFMHGHRGWEPRSATTQSWSQQFLSGASEVGRQWLFFDGEKLVGVALMDEVEGAISLVYCFYDPDWRAKSPGTFCILTQLLYGKQKRLDYAYLGYWVRDCQSLAYKQRFRPHEILTRYPEAGESPDWRLVA
jgi:arginyl-tRNA--protein-N-Asp/Glu arginylyltransferase